MSTETAIAGEKRKGSHEALAAKETNPKRIEISTETPESPSLITLLVNDKFIKDLAHILAADRNLVCKAKKLFEPLQGAEDEHGTLDLDEWQHFASLHIWQNEQLRSRLRQHSVSLAMIVPEQARVDQQIKEEIARIKDDSSLKPLFIEKEHIRVVLITLIMFWSRKDVLGDLSEPMDDENFASPDDLSETFYDDEVEMECCYEAPYRKEMIVSFIHEPEMKDLAQEVLKDDKIKQILEELLSTVRVDSLQHFDKVKEVWGDRRFIDILLKVGVLPDSWTPCMIVAQRRLSKFLMSLIMKDTLFDMILCYDDPDFMMRVALSILIGFWSNEDTLCPVVCTMGGEALGVKTRHSEAEFQEEETPVAASTEESPEFFDDVLMSDPPSIIDVYCDESIGILAHQLKEVPGAVELTRNYLESLKDGCCLCTYEIHMRTAMFFWYTPSIRVHLIEAVKKDPKLTKVLTKYLKRGQALRCRDRMTYIREDLQHHWDTNSCDPASRMRLALSILFGYWGDSDVSALFRVVHSVRTKIDRFDLNGEKIAAFHYFARSSRDMEGLENWLARKYGRGSKKFMDLAREIGNYQIAKGEAAKELGYSEGDWVAIQLLMKNESVLCFWFDFSVNENAFVLVGYPYKEVDQ